MEVLTPTKERMFNGWAVFHHPDSNHFTTVHRTGRRTRTEKKGCHVRGWAANIFNRPWKALTSLKYIFTY